MWPWTAVTLLRGRSRWGDCLRKTTVSFQMNCIKWTAWGCGHLISPFLDSFTVWPFSFDKNEEFWHHNVKTVKRHCSCFGFRVLVSGLWVPVFCNAPQNLLMHHIFFVMHWYITQCVRGRGGRITKKMMHYKKLVPVTWKLVPETPNKNNVFCRPPQCDSHCRSSLQKRSKTTVNYKFKGCVKLREFLLDDRNELW